jgi:hypothetical protein
LHHVGGSCRVECLDGFRFGLMFLMINKLLHFFFVALSKFHTHTEGRPSLP